MIIIAVVFLVGLSFLVAAYVVAPETQPSPDDNEGE